MSEVRREARHFSGILFVACMFIGGGIGMLFNHTGAGWILGMGVGFLLMALVKLKGVEPTPIAITLPKTLPFILLTAIGGLLILSGACLILNPQLLYPYLIGFITIAIGLLLAASGLIGFKRRG